MKLEHLDKAHEIQQRMKKVRVLRTLVGESSLENYPLAYVKYLRDPPPETVTIGTDATLDRARFIVFLDGEISALNLELHNLGVELPGVATIEGARAITKGHDQ